MNQVILLTIILASVTAQTTPIPEVPDTTVHCIEVANYAQYQNLLANSTGKLVVAKIETKTCPGCVYLAPGLEELADKYADQCVIMNVDYFKVPQPMWEFKCPKIPTIIIFKDGLVVREQFVSSDKTRVEGEIINTLKACNMTSPQEGPEGPL